MQIHNKPFAIVDMGTNTFHLLVAANDAGVLKPIFERKQGVRLGKGGISEGTLTPDAMTRALVCLQGFVLDAAAHGVGLGQIFAFATSAVRSAANGHAFAAQIEAELGFGVKVLDGLAEADYIFAGVRASGAVQDVAAPVLVMDIGGGSVEFILGDRTGHIWWLQSFELGGQRLVDSYMVQDPIAPKDAARLRKDLRRHLAPLQKACQRYKPEVLVGASGTFDTLRQFENPNETQPHTLPWQELSPKLAAETTSKLQGMNLSERLAFAAISELRADMIVVALILLEVALELSGAARLRQTDWALKEGVATRLLVG